MCPISFLWSLNTLIFGNIKVLLQNSNIIPIIVEKFLGEGLLEWWFWPSRVGWDFVYTSLHYISPFKTPDTDFLCHLIFVPVHNQNENDTHISIMCIYFKGNVIKDRGHKNYWGHIKLIIRWTLPSWGNQLEMLLKINIKCISQGCALTTKYNLLVFWKWNSFLPPMSTARDSFKSKPLLLGWRSKVHMHTN